MKLNLGCASTLMKGYINIDLDSYEEIKKRYPNINISSDTEFLQANIFDLPFEEDSIEEIRCDSLIEHLSFKEEKIFFTSMFKLLKKGGRLNVSTTDFESIVKKWLAAKDEWLEFYRDDDEAIKKTHWFGTYSYDTKNRWGYLAASIYGPQNSEGQFHKNCYTEKKLRAIYNFLGLSKVSVERYLWKGDRDEMIRVIGTKK